MSRELRRYVTGAPTASDGEGLEEASGRGRLRRSQPTRLDSVVPCGGDGAPTAAAG